MPCGYLSKGECGWYILTDGRMYPWAELREAPTNGATHVSNARVSGVEQWQRERQCARACVWSTKTGFRTTSLSHFVPVRVGTHRKKWTAFFLNMSKRVWRICGSSGCPGVPF
jgi:hypothetical protein